MKQKQLEYMIDGMDCADCALKIENSIRKLDGIKKFRVNFMSQKLVIEDHTISDIDHILIKTIKKSGYSLRPVSKKRSESLSFSQNLIPLIISGIFLLAGGVLRFNHFPGEITISLLTIAIILGGYKIAMKAYSELKSLRPGINLLMTIAVIGAGIIGEWTEAAAVVFLFALAEWLESFSLDKARKSIESLLKLVPEMAIVLQDGRELSLPVEDVKSGQIVLIKPGMRLPLDGLVIHGDSYIDQSPVTGESQPVFKHKGDKVFAGTLNQFGALEVQVTANSDDTVLAGIIKLVEKAQSEKAPIQSFVEKFSGYYTPAVVAMAFMVAVIPPLLWNQPFSEWFYRSLVLLVISCPCALVISTPVAIVSALSHAARKGILIKGGNYLEVFDRITAIAFDKTGTLTYGTPVVEKFMVLNEHRENELLSFAISLESKAEHPIAESICNYARQKGIEAQQVESFKIIPGLGVSGMIDGQTINIGNARYFDEVLPLQKQILPDPGGEKTRVYIGNGERVFGYFDIADQIRENAYETVNKLKSAGVDKIIMMSGDHQNVAKNMARHVGIDILHAELMPEDKVRLIETLAQKYGQVCMVGDGVNDAPALAKATVGIGMGQTGSDVTLETADIVLMHDDLAMIPHLKSLSSATVARIRENIAIALGLKLIFLVLAVPGLATLWMAVFADMGASLIVIFNSLRLIRFTDKKA
ncbi:MAG: heavy metal translocating P-type ATPase [Calditrichaceae bacterium]